MWSSSGGALGNAAYFVSPIVHRLLVVDLLAETADDGAGGPDGALRSLFLEHLVQDGNHPVLELAVVVVRHDEVTYAIHAAPPQVRAVKVEIGEVRLAEALDEVLFDAASGGHERADVLMLHEVQDDLAQARGNEVRGVAQENVALYVLPHFRIAELFVLVVSDRLV